MKWSWPVDKKWPISQAWGENPAVYKSFGLPGHNGLDFAVPEGTPVLAAADGIVEYVGNDPNGYGIHVRVVHDDGIVSLYGHFSKRLVNTGDNVSGGQVIGHSGNTGFSTGPHLHFGIRMADRSGVYKGWVDPMLYLAGTIEAAKSSNGLMVVAEGGVNLRCGPGLSAVVAVTLPYGFGLVPAALEVVKADGLEWQPVVLWVAKELVK